MHRKRVRSVRTSVYWVSNSSARFRNVKASSSRPTFIYNRWYPYIWCNHRMIQPKHTLHFLSFGIYRPCDRIRSKSSRAHKCRRKKDESSKIMKKSEKIRAYQRRRIWLQNHSAWESNVWEEAHIPGHPNGRCSFELITHSPGGWHKAPYHSSPNHRKQNKNQEIHTHGYTENTNKSTNNHNNKEQNGKEANSSFCVDFNIPISVHRLQHYSTPKFVQSSIACLDYPTPGTLSNDPTAVPSIHIRK